MSEARTRSNWWYLVPIIFDGIPGGVVAYFAIRYDEPRKAKKLSVSWNHYNSNRICSTPCLLDNDG